MGRAARTGFATFTVLTLALVGCVGRASGPSPTEPHGFTTTTTASTTTTTLSVEDSVVGWRECLAGQDVPIGEMRLDGRGRPRMADALSELDLTDQGVLSALEDCSSHLAGGLLALGPDPELAELVRDSLSEFAECVRLQGVSDYPDPIRGFDGVGSPFPVDRVPWSDPGLPDAVDVCSDVLGV